MAGPPNAAAQQWSDHRGAGTCRRCLFAAALRALLSGLAATLILGSHACMRASPLDDRPVQGAPTSLDADKCMHLCVCLCRRLWSALSSCWTTWAQRGATRPAHPRSSKDSSPGARAPPQECRSTRSSRRRWGPRQTGGSPARLSCRSRRVLLLQVQRRRSRQAVPSQQQVRWQQCTLPLGHSLLTPPLLTPPQPRL